MQRRQWADLVIGCGRNHRDLLGLWPDHRLSRESIMAKKKAAKMVAAAEPKTRPVRLDLSAEDHDRLRIRAAKSRLSMAAYARMVLMQAIDREETGER